jgi:hypothetical protein
MMFCTQALAIKTIVIPVLCGDPVGRPAVLLNLENLHVTRGRASGSPHKAGMTSVGVA